MPLPPSFRPCIYRLLDAILFLGAEDRCRIDVQIPGSRDGFALARECAERWPHVKIVVASGQTKPGPNDVPGGAIFIGKPFSADVVHSRLQEILLEGQKPEPLKRKRELTPGSWLTEGSV